MSAPSCGPAVWKLDPPPSWAFLQTVSQNTSTFFFFSTSTSVVCWNCWIKSMVLARLTLMESIVSFCATPTVTKSEHSTWCLLLIAPSFSRIPARFSWKPTPDSEAKTFNFLFEEILSGKREELFSYRHNDIVWNSFYWFSLPHRICFSIRLQNYKFHPHFPLIQNLFALSPEVIRDILVTFLAMSRSYEFFRFFSNKVSWEISSFKWHSFEKLLLKSAGSGTNKQYSTKMSFIKCRKSATIFF